MSYSLDVNILLYASDKASPKHEAAMRFLDECAAGREALYIAWPTAMGYLRMATHPRIFADPLTPEEALDNLEQLLCLPQVRLVSEGDGFLASYRKWMAEIAPTGNLVPDAHLAVLLHQYGVETLYTTDRDFDRFSFLIAARDPLG